MSKTLRRLLAKLKQRRKSRSTTYHSGKNGVHDPEQGSGIAEQMSGLTLSPTDSTPAEDTMTGPLVFGSSQDFEFEFKLMSGKEWPGPRYDAHSLFAPGVYDKARPTRPKSKQKSSKRKPSQEGGQITLRANQRPSIKHSKEPGHGKKSTRPFQHYGSRSSRDPPLHLLDLPGEIRNQIFRALYVRDEPIVAQFRPIIRPKMGHGRRAKLFETNRRFPREPAVALACRQLHKEVLSIFYGENKFVFRQSDDPKFRSLIMTRTGMIEKWAPKLGLANSLRHVEVQLFIRLGSGSNERIDYIFRKADGRLLLSHRTSTDVYCTCFDKRVLETLRSGLEGTEECADLVKEAVKAITKRTDQLRSDESLVTVRTSGLRFWTTKMTCDDCGRDTVTFLDSGM